MVINLQSRTSEWVVVINVQRKTSERVVLRFYHQNNPLTCSPLYAFALKTTHLDVLLSCFDGKFYGGEHLSGLF